MSFTTAPPGRRPRSRVRGRAPDPGPAPAGGRPASNLVRVTSVDPENRPAYPAAERLDLVEQRHGLTLADPYRWLEDPADPRTVAWSAAAGRRSPAPAWTRCPAGTG